MFKNNQRYRVNRQIGVVDMGGNKLDFCIKLKCVEANGVYATLQRRDVKPNTCHIFPHSEIGKFDAIGG
jgi:hypothetical protein